MKTRILHGDCVLAMDELADESVDVVVTSPPFNLGVTYGENYNDSEQRADFLLWCEIWLHRIKCVLKPNGSFFLNVGASPANPLLPFEIVPLALKCFTLQNTFHWIKAITVQRACVCEGKISDCHLCGGLGIRYKSSGHFKPISSKRYVNDCHEYVFHFTRSGNVNINRLAIGVPYQDKSNVKRWKGTDGNDLRCRGNTWFIPYSTIQTKRAHPAEFPVRLAENCIKLHGAKGATVLDPFVGGGNAGIAARNCKAAQFIGIDCEETYCALAKQRIVKA